MEVIDEGGFGCIIKPPLRCRKGPAPKPTMISKLQPNKYANYEMKQIHKVKAICRKIPNCDDFAVLDVNKCHPLLQPSKLNKTKCSLLEERLTKESYMVDGTKRRRKTVKKGDHGKTDLSIINMPYMGINLHRYIISNVDFKRPGAFEQINNSIISLYQNFIRPLNKNRVYHNDIKTLNILVGKDGHYRLIDWGIANNIVFSHRFIFNKPYMYILLSNYFIDKIQELKKKSGGVLNKSEVESAIVQYAELIKLNKSSDYLYTREILEFLYPKSDIPSQGHGYEIITPVLKDCLVKTAMRFTSLKEWTDIYVHNIDIVGVALMYPDILCAMAMKHVNNLKLRDAIIQLYNKYVLECYEKINPEEFINDLNKLNLQVI